MFMCLCLLDIAVELLQKSAPSPIRKLQKKYAAHVARWVPLLQCQWCMQVNFLKQSEIRHSVLWDSRRRVMQKGWDRFNLRQMRIKFLHFSILKWTRSMLTDLIYHCSMWTAEQSEWNNEFDMADIAFMCLWRVDYFFASNSVHQYYQFFLLWDFVNVVTQSAMHTHRHYCISWKS